MGKKLLLSAVNILIISIPLYFIWGLYGYLYAVTFQICLIMLLFWNILGDIVIQRMVFHGKSLPNNAEMKPAIDRYFHYLESKKIIDRDESKTVIWTNSSLAYFIPISERSFVVSIALQDALIKNGSKLLLENISDSTYMPGVLFPRKILLLTVFTYVVTLRFLEIWAIIFAFGVKVILSIAMIVATGALFETADDVCNAISLGSALGTIALKINEWVNYVQDKLVELLVRETVLGHFNVVKHEMSIK